MGNEDDQAPGTAPGTGEAPTRIRTSDAEKERFADVLRNAVTEGRLTLEEGDERLATLYAATYRDELPGLLSDLPEGGGFRAATPGGTGDAPGGGRWGGPPWARRRAGTADGGATGGDATGGGAVGSDRGPTGGDHAGAGWNRGGWDRSGWNPGGRGPGGGDATGWGPGYGDSAGWGPAGPGSGAAGDEPGSTGPGNTGPGNGWPDNGWPGAWGQGNSGRGTWGPGGFGPGGFGPSGWGPGGWGPGFGPGGGWGPGGSGGPGGGPFDPAAWRRRRVARLVVLALVVAGMIVFTALTGHFFWPIIPILVIGSFLRMRWHCAARCWYGGGYGPGRGAPGSGR